MNLKISAGEYLFSSATRNTVKIEDPEPFAHPVPLLAENDRESLKTAKLL